MKERFRLVTVVVDLPLITVHVFFPTVDAVVGAAVVTVVAARREESATTVARVDTLVTTFAQPRCAGILMEGVSVRRMATVSAGCTVHVTRSAHLISVAQVEVATLTLVVGHTTSVVVLTTSAETREGEVTRATCAISAVIEEKRNVRAPV